MREENGTTTVDTGFIAQFGGGSVILPLDAFYGSTVAGQVGQWPVDGHGRVAKIAGSSTPGFLNRLESMPDGPIQIGQTWTSITPSDSEAMASSEAVMQTKRTWRVDDSISTPTGTAVRVHVDGWSRFIENATLTQFLTDSGIDNPQPDFTPNLSATIDVELASGTLLGMKLYEDFLGDAATPDELPGSVGSSTYCIDLTSGYTASPDICGWNQ